MILLQNAELFSPTAMGQCDLLVAGGQVTAIAERLSVPTNWDVVALDCQGLRVMPGLVDGHVHIAGAGGEGGPASRTPEVDLAMLLAGGVTSVVGCLGTDGFTRGIQSLVMKAKALKAQGISCWTYTGSYQVPTPTLFDDVAHDLCYIEEVIGAGEIALADHRSSSPSCAELTRLTKHCRIGGMLSGKAGMVHIHLGDAPASFDMINQVVTVSELTHKDFFPTHVNRNRLVFEAAKAYGRHGWVDITASSYPYFPDEEVKPSKAIAGLLAAGVPGEHITMSSDAGGSLPNFDDAGQLVSVNMGRSESLLTELRDAVEDDGVPLAQALACVTANPANILKLPGKGRLAVGADGDVVVLDHDYQLRHLIARGRLLIRDGKPLVPASQGA